MVTLLGSLCLIGEGILILFLRVKSAPVENSINFFHGTIAKQFSANPFLVKFKLWFSLNLKDRDGPPLLLMEKSFYRQLFTF